MFGGQKLIRIKFPDRCHVRVPVSARSEMTADAKSGG